jgi:hypothetical protein
MQILMAIDLLLDLIFFTNAAIWQYIEKNNFFRERSFGLKGVIYE